MSSNPVIDLAPAGGVAFPFGAKSLAQLATCDAKLQVLFHEVSKYRNHSIIIGHRGQKEQDEAFRNGFSKLKFPHGEHNGIPSRAVDTAPHPIDWNNRERFLVFGGFVLGVAAKLGIKIRWGGDWDGDGNPRNQTFHDPGHFELA